MSFDDDSDDDPLMQTVTGARDDDESGLYSPATGGLTERGACPNLDAYPIGSRVCLPDTAEDLRRLQQEEHWEAHPMEEIAGATGTVVRHTGDYTLVQFYIEDVKMCTTIFRGALMPVGIVGDEEEEMKLLLAGGGGGSRRASLTSPMGSEGLIGVDVTSNRSDSVTSGGGGFLMNVGSGLVMHKSMTEPLGGFSSSISQQVFSAQVTTEEGSSHHLTAHTTDNTHNPKPSSRRSSMTAEPGEVGAPHPSTAAELFAMQARIEYDEGGKCFGVKDYQGAVTHFSASLVALVDGEEERAREEGAATAAEEGGSDAPVTMSSSYSIPTAVGAHYILSNRSVAHLALGNHDAAFEDAQLAISIKPSSTKGYVRAGNVHRSLRQYTQAKKLFSTALKADPTNPEIQYLLKSSQVSELYSRNGNLSQVHLSWNRKGNKLLIRSRRTTDNRHQLLSELPLFAVGTSQSTATASTVGGKGCDYCCRTLIEPHVLEAARAISPQLEQLVLGRLQQHFPAVPCSNGCGVLYCSDECRDRALCSFHAVECTSANSPTRWPALDLCCVGGACNLTEVECSQLHLGLRIIATAVTRIRAERPSNFDAFILDLLPALPQDRAGLTPAMSEAVHDIYQSLRTHSLLTSNEKALVTEAHWIRVVCVVVANAKFVSCSPWEELATSLWTRCVNSTGEFDPSEPLSPTAAGVSKCSNASSPGGGNNIVTSNFTHSQSGEDGEPVHHRRVSTISLAPPGEGGGIIDFSPGRPDASPLPEDDEETITLKRLLQMQISELATQTVEGLSCRNQACVIFPTLPHMKRDSKEKGNLKVYHQGFWKPTLVGVTTRPIRGGEEVSVEETNEGFTASCARQSGALGAGIPVSSPGLGSVRPVGINGARWSGVGALPRGGALGEERERVEPPETPFSLETVPTGMN